MPRYYDMDKLAELCEAKSETLFGDGKVIYLNVARWLSLLPPADVVPRSEVEALEREIDRLKYILRSYALQYGTVMGQQKVIDEIKREVAREIFEEMDILGTYNLTLYAELKKKYTEGE